MALLVSYLAQHASRAEEELERKTQDLAQLEHFHRDVTRSLASGLITTDLNGRVMTINPAGQTILAIAETQVVGQPIWTIGLLDREQWDFLARVPGDGRRRDRAPWSSAARRHDPPRLLGQPLHRPRRQHARLHLHLPGRHPLAAARAAVRIKDRMAAIGELSAGPRARDRQSAGRDLRLGAAAVVERAAVDASAHRLLEIILNESQRLDRTIKGFLRFARPGERTEIEFDIGEALRENVELLRNSDEVTRPTPSISSSIRRRSSSDPRRSRPDRADLLEPGAQRPARDARTAAGSTCAAA